MNEFLAKPVIGSNTVEDLLWAGGILLLGLLLQLLFTRLIARFIYGFLKKHSHGVPFEKLFELLNRPMGWFIVFVSIYFAFSQLTVPVQWKMAPPDKVGLRMFAERTLFLCIAFSFTRIVLRVIDFFGLILMKRALLTESKTDDQLVPFLREAIKVVVVILSIFFVLGAIFHINVASLIAGVGIGGLAVALAAKESVENLMGSFTIFLDKPFVVGDHIKIGNVEGTVESIGFRSTRIRTLEKSLVMLPNKKMVDSELDNLTKRSHRRVKQVIGLLYGTSENQVKKIVADLQAFFEYHPHIDSNMSTIRFTDLGASSLNLLADYFVVSNEAALFLSVREEVNFKIIEIVHRHGSDFAYTTQTVLVKGK